MKIDIVTLFPNMFKGPFDESIIQRARDKSLVEINIHNLRRWAKDKRGTVDDRPYGGGPGMILRVDVIDEALKALKPPATSLPRRQAGHQPPARIILLDPKGEMFNQAKTKQLSKLDHLILICGHYEGVDARVDKLVDEKISIGKYVLTGGELPAMVIVDSVVRLLPGALGNPESLKEESYSQSLTNHKSQITLSIPNTLVRQIIGD